MFGVIYILERLDMLYFSSSWGLSHASLQSWAMEDLLIWEPHAPTWAAHVSTTPLPWMHSLESSSHLCPSIPTVLSQGCSHQQGLTVPKLPHTDFCGSSLPLPPSDFQLPHICSSHPCSVHSHCNDLSDPDRYLSHFLSSCSLSGSKYSNWTQGQDLLIFSCLSISNDWG